MSYNIKILLVYGWGSVAEKTSLGSPAEKTSEIGKTLTGEEGLTT